MRDSGGRGSRGSSGREGFRRDSDRGGGFNRSFEPREKHKAVCSECGEECEVPFKPTEGKPVFCLECFKKRKKS